MKIEKKAWPEHFQRIWDGKKKYELRLADWECNSRDVLLLKEWNPKTKKYTGREIEKKITHVMKTKDLPFWLEEEVQKHVFQIISFE